jgi:hypothetical protein
LIPLAGASLEHLPPPAPPQQQQSLR